MENLAFCLLSAPDALLFVVLWLYDAVNWLMVWSVVFKLGAVLFALYAVLRMLSHYDSRADINWRREVWGEIKHEPMAMAIYFGLRFMGIAILVGLAIH